MLVVIASPKDLAPAEMDREKEAIQRALKPMTDNNVAVVEVLSGATRASLQQALERPFHIVHFITHGNFDVAGADPSTRAFLCLQSPTGDTDPLDSELLDAMLHDTDVRLVVITACSSAKPTPDDDVHPYGIGAFDGIAQHLVGSASSVTAVVAMQFDMEGNAAVVFNEAFYRNLLQPGKALDEALARARKAVAVIMDMGHRAWINPTLYWRCRNGQAFTIREMHSALDEQARKQIADIDAEIDRIQKQIDQITSQPAGLQVVLRPQLDDYTRRIETLNGQRSLLLGNSVRIWGGRGKAGEKVTCRLTLKLRAPARIGTVMVDVTFPQKVVRLVGSAPGANVAAANVEAPGEGAAGVLQVRVVNASAGDQWPANEYELCRLDFQIADGASLPAIVLGVAIRQFDSDPALSFSKLDGMIFIEPPPV